MQNITLTPAQKKIVQSRARFKTIRAGRRFGKSWLSAWEMFAMATAKETRQIYFAPTYEEAYNIMWHELVAIAENAISRKNETRMEMWISNMDGTTSYIRLSGWDLKVADRVRGQKYHHVWVDEVAKMRDFEYYWQNAVLPTLIDYNGGATFLSTPRGFNHFYDLCNREGKDWEHFHFTSYDNPHLPEGAVEALLEELGKEAESQEILAEFTRQQGLVYTEFYRERHVKEKPPFKHNTTLVGVDFGFTHPAAVISIHTDGKNYHIADEWYEVGRTHEEIADHVGLIQANAIYPDPASPEAIEVMRKRGLPVKEVKKGKDSIMMGINKVKHLLRSGRLTISPTCKNTLKELDMYVWDDSKDAPIKEYDHACFAAGTIVNGKDIKEIGVQTGIKDVYEYEIAGELITATPEHPVLTHRGLVAIDTLRYNDIIWKNNQTKKSLFMTVSSGIGIRTVTGGLTGLTFVAIQRIVRASVRDFIDIYGKNITGKYLMGIIFTTLMAILSIMKLLTWSVYTAVNTCVFIGTKKKKNGQEKISKKQSKQQVIGQKPHKVKKEEHKLEKKMQSILQNFGTIVKKRFVIFATKNTQQRKRARDGVTQTVEPKRYVGLEPVYTLRTKSGTYQANGILVSNCDAIRYVLMTYEILYNKNSPQHHANKRLIKKAYATQHGL